MAGNVRGLVLGIARETVLAFVTWVLAATGLFVAFRLSLGGLRKRIIRQNPSVSEGRIEERIYEFFPVDQGATLDQWVNWVVSYSTFDLGTSISQSAPVSDIVTSAFGASVFLVVAVALVGVVMAVPLLWLTAHFEDSTLRTLLSAPAYAFAVLAPLLTGLGLVTFAYVTESIPIRLSGPDAQAPVSNVGLLVLVAAVVAIPVVADAVRRVNRERVASDGIGGLVEVLGPGRGGLGTLEVWLYVTYVASSLVAVEQLFDAPGVGWYLFESVDAFDVPLLLGLTGSVLFVLVFLGYLRNLAWVVARYLRETDRESAADVSGPTPDVGTVLQTVASQPKVVAGGVLLGFLAIVGFVGSALLSSETPFPQGGRDAIGVGPGQFVNTVGSLLAVTLVALLIALALGASFGLLAGYLEGSVGGPAGSLGTLLRIPADSAILGPLSFIVAIWLVVLGFGQSRTAAELAIGLAAGLVTAGYVFRATYEAASERCHPDRAVGGAVAESLVAGLARVDGVFVVTLFVTGEIAFLGVVLPDVAPAFTQLDIGLRAQSLLLTQPGKFAVLLVQALATVGVPALGVALLGDGLGEAAAELRTARPPELGGAVEPGAETSGPADDTGAGDIA